MNEPGVEVLCDQGTFADRVAAGEMPSWVESHWEAFRTSMERERNDTPFPCFFGKESFEEGRPLYTACRSTTDRDALLSLRDTLLEYLDTYRDHGERVSLVTFFAPPSEPLTEADYHEVLWHVLQFLHVHDPEPWPEHIPTDPDDERWEFCFGGEPMFPTCRAPFYDERKSRYCPVGLEITFQPRSLFDGITADTDAGQQAREVIQDRLESYDGVCPHADLGDWGVEGDREWPQYLFYSDPEHQPEECPLTVTRGPGPAADLP
ncbi:YqcI/YcgG family protein [Haloarculaceae archaeon H-GB2-1]|nr:YqcI/YcgG family protein [Haloarculaceae archaeon H-GB1-1]MEA5385950.1 YqcI/YcgG family protein [Haloarculaceae archaeon H-GB11]MEA5407456.1 YqcI/YcgG family protein [Haloarculaceae archaeon H-GB2-1]